MPYYGMKGDYYRGDYYRGDPGFFSFLGGLAKSAVGLIPGVGPVLSKIIPGGAGSAAGAGMGAIVRATAGKAVTTVAKHPVLSAAGAAGITAMGGAAVGHALAAPGAAGKGFHVSRKTGHVVRNRHMRVTNPKALRRSLRRVAGFARIARRVLHFTHPRVARGRAHFRFPKRRKAA